MARTSRFIHVELPIKSSLVPVLMKSVKSALLVKDSETRYVSNQGGCAMHLRIGEEDDNSLKAHIMLADEIALYDFLKALIALENQILEGYAELYDEELDNHRVFVRYLTYRIDFPPSGHLEKKQRRLETLLLIFLRPLLERFPVCDHHRCKGRGPAG